jgi:hypothetical protein
MALIIASAGLEDEDFLAAFSSCALPLSSFRHGDHLRLAWLQLQRNPLDEALKLVPDIFHETVTTAWVKLLSTHCESNFEEFIAVNEYRLNQALLHRFWTPSLLNSEEARRGWVPLDREALPN